MNPPLIRQFGVADYLSTYTAMRDFTLQRSADTRDELWLVEHAPVFTLGLGADPAHVLCDALVPPHAIPVIQTDRGGEVTYHGPGQAVIYLLLDLRRRGAGQRWHVRELVSRIEQAVINLLATYNLAGERKPGAPGIYVAHGQEQPAKIAALGLKVRANGCTYHGVALNVAMDLRPFAWINPCGYPGLSTVDLQTLGVTVALPQVQLALAEALTAQLLAE